MRKTDLANGMSIVDIPDAGLSVLCGCPENAIKFLIKSGAVSQVESGGLRFETGPNAILLSERPVQGGRFRNLGEFPVLHMLYKQGMLLPGHPNNKGHKPMIIGMRDQVGAQARYIFSGNYGLPSVEEIEAAGAGRELAEELYRMKLRFAFGSIKPSEQLLDLRVIDANAIELRGGAFLRRVAANRYEFLFGGQAIEVGLDPPEAHELPYELPRLSCVRDEFSILHIGEGDGWDTNRPCMGSIVIYKGEPYLVDAGPDIDASLEAVGLGVNDLRGLFQTHAHDDHFVGLTALLRAERRLAYYAVPWVRASVEDKLRAITGIGDREFRRYFDVRDLEEGRWNDIGGLEVLPTLSPHPVETTVLRFRARDSALDGSPYREYAHLADIASFSVLDSMVSPDPGKPGISPERASSSKAAYLAPADLKKIDSGGGMIHGSAADFVEDESGLVLISHTSTPAKTEGVPRRAVAAFGDQTRLIASEGDYSWKLALGYLRRLFPSVSLERLGALASCPRRDLSSGEFLLAPGSPVSDLYLLLSGAFERASPDSVPPRRVEAGSLVGALECIAGSQMPSHRALTESSALRIPIALFRDFLRIERLETTMEELCGTMAFLDECPVLGGLASTSSLADFAGGATIERFAEGESLAGSGARGRVGSGSRRGASGLLVILEGKASLVAGGRRLGEIGPREAFGEEAILSEDFCLFDARAQSSLVAYRIARRSVEDKPIVLWRLRELYDERLAAAKSIFEFSWRPEYSVGVPELDESHRRLFGLIDELDRGLGEMSCGADGERLIDELASFAKSHFVNEESYMFRAGYPELSSHRKEHEKLLGTLAEHRRRFDCGDEAALADLDGFLKDWVLRHTLLLDRLYIPYL